MSSEPRRKDQHRAREKPAGLEPSEENAPPPEEYTGYQETAADKASPETSEARREADLQPGASDNEPPPDEKQGLRRPNR